MIAMHKENNRESGGRLLNKFQVVMGVKGGEI